MKKILSIIFCLVVISSLSGCYSSENEKLAKEIRKEAEQIAIKYIENKYSFKPKIESVQEIKEGSEYSFMRTPTKEVQVDMSYKGREFTTFVAGEYMNGKCYDNYEQEKLTTLLEEYMKDIFPIQELNLKVTAVAGYQSGYTTNMPRNLVHEKVSSNLLTTITEEENPLNVYYMVEFSSPENIAKTIHRQDFEDLYFLPDDKLGSIERRVILINYWNEEEIGKIKPEDINFGEIQEELYYYNNTAVYAKELKIINIDTFNDGGGEQYYLNEKPIEFGDYTFVGTNNNILNVEKCTDTIKSLTDREDYEEYQEEIGCYKVNTSNNKGIKVYIDKNKIDYKELVPKKGSSSHIFLSQDDYGLRTESSFIVGDYLGTSIWGSDNGEIKFFLGRR